MSKKLLIYFLFSLVTIFTTYSQYYSSGPDPAGIKWYQIKTEHFRFVFPEEFKEQAQRTAAIFENVYLYGGYTLGHKPKKIDVLIHSRSAYSNGFVSWAPKRIELYPTPDQDIFAQDYLQQLAIHEFRHVVQIDKLNTGFTKALSIIAGQQAVGAVLGIYLPMWFMEGDAVTTETLLSHSGRGRLPSFEQELKAQLLEKKMYRYDKAYLGSYRDYVPNYYVMGYHLVMGARSRYGKDIWERAVENTGKRSWSITPFNHGIKEITGLNKTQLYKSVFNDWKKLWIEKNSAKTFSRFKYITPRDPKYKNYLFPKFLNDTTVVAKVSGPGEVTRFVTINIKNDKESTLYTPGYTEDVPFSLMAGKMAWTEQEQNYRWSNAEQSNVWIYDLSSGKVKRLTRGKRYFAPAISPDGKTISVVHVSDSESYNIMFIDPNTGKTTDTIRTPDNMFPMTPVWTPDGSKLVTIIFTPEGKQIYYLSLSDKKWHKVTATTYSNIRHPFVTNDHIYFSGSWDNTENIYRTEFNSGITEQITSSRFGATAATLDDKGSKLILSDYSSDGYRLAELSMDSITPVITEFRQAAPQYKLLERPLKEEKGVPDLPHLSTDTFNIKKYSKWNIFNFHSWAPAYINFNDEQIDWGASLLSQNLLGNAFTTFGYNADKQYTREKFYFNFIYNGWFPELNFKMKFGNDDAYYDGSTQTDTFVVNSIKKQNFLELGLDISFPFNFSRRAWSRHIEPIIGLGYIKAFDYEAKKSYITQISGEWQYTGETEDITAEGYVLTPLDYSLFMYNIRKRSYRDITARWGQVLQVIYRHTPYGTHDFGSLTGIHSSVYFPGIWRHHSIKIDNDWHKKKRGDYGGVSGSGYIINSGFSDYIKFARGYSAQYNDELYTLRTNYIFPVLYPDLSLGSLAYFKRFSLDLFYDVSHATYKVQSNDTGNWHYASNYYQSTGFELRTEVNLLRFIFPFNIGYRFSYLLSDTKVHNEFLFSVNFSGYTINKKM